MIMGYSDVRVSPIAGSNLVDVEARGGTRRQRAAGIASAVRAAYPDGLDRVHVSYSETYGFDTLTRIRFRNRHVPRSGRTGDVFAGELRSGDRIGGVMVATVWDAGEGYVSVWLDGEATGTRYSVNDVVTVAS